MRIPCPWFREQTQSWYVKIGGTSTRWVGTPAPTGPARKAAKEAAKLARSPRAEHARFQENWIEVQ